MLTRKTRGIEGGEMSPALFIDKSEMPVGNLSRDGQMVLRYFLMKN